MAMAASPQGTVVLIDIVDMGVIDRRHGRRVGDRLLRAIQRSVRKRLAAATVTRLPGDQFAVVLPTVAGQVDAEAEVVEAARRAGVRGRRGEVVRSSALPGSAAWGVTSAAEAPLSADQAFWVAAKRLANAKRQAASGRATGPRQV
ncbi:diguanylate cyclase (GGDEF)-like protein [Agrococcus sp. UYP10]|uniref:diguanylate cyclase n=1 Tax=Agrococcus sp. UYP10 TaxID=1756355 RepID=UPI003397EB91